MKLVKSADGEREIHKCDFGVQEVNAGRCASLLVSCPPYWKGCPAETLHECFDIFVSQAPIPVAVANKQELVYEVHLTNFSSDDAENPSTIVYSGQTRNRIYRIRMRRQRTAC
jgi:hypothetical protein